MSGIIQPDSKAYLIEKLAENFEHFELSTNIYKNGKGVTAIYETRRLRADLMSFARDPQRGLEELGPPPKQPDLDKYPTDEAKREAEHEFIVQMNMWNMFKLALTHQVPPEDLMTINEYMKPFDDATASVGSIKGKKWHSLTKPVTEEQGGLGGFFHKKGQQQG